MKLSQPDRDMDEAVRTEIRDMLQEVPEVEEWEAVSFLGHFGEWVGIGLCACAVALIVYYFKFW